MVRLQDSPVCDVLGMPQRRWVQEQLQRSSTPLKIVGSGSVLLGSLTFKDEDGNECSEDDWYCWPNAQVNLLHTLANVSAGCLVLITGDYHYSDIKVGGGSPGACLTLKF